MTPYNYSKRIVPKPILPETVRAESGTPLNTNFAYATNFHLTIPKISEAVYFCTEVVFPEFSCDAIRLPARFAPTLKFYGNKINHGDMTVKFIVNEDYSNYRQVESWFKSTLVWEDFFRTGDDFRQLSNVGQLLILSNKKNPIARFVLNGLFVTNLTNIEYNSALTDTPVSTATATFQFSTYDLGTL